VEIKERKKEAKKERKAEWPVEKWKTHRKVPMSVIPEFCFPLSHRPGCDQSINLELDRTDHVSQKPDSLTCY
jgi:hypothetical protein